MTISPLSKPRSRRPARQGSPDPESTFRGLALSAERAYRTSVRQLARTVPRTQVRRPSAMQPSRLVATLLSLSLGFQLALAAAGVTCVMPSSGAAHESSAATSQMDMAGMDMSGMDMAGMPMGEGAAPSSHSHGPDGAPCDQPGTPEACQVMAPCAGAFVAVAPNRVRAPVDVPAGVLAVSVATPPSRTIPPELPPPRA